MEKIKTQKLKKYGLGFGISILCIVILLLLSMTYFPKMTSNMIKIYFYPAVSEGSLETIPQNALVLSSVNHNIEVGDQIVFDTERFGKETTLIQKVTKMYTMKNNDLYYKTSNQNTNTPEEYLVKDDKVIGEFLFQIPYLGLIMVFMKSKYMFILVLCIIQVFLFIKLRKTEKIEELKKRKRKKREYIMITRMCIEHIEDEMVISGVIENHLHQTVKYVVAQLDLYDKNDNRILNEQWDVLDQKMLASGESVKFTYKIPYNDDVVDYSLRIRKYRY